MAVVIIINTFAFMFKDYRPRVREPYSNPVLQDTLTILNDLLFVMYCLECLIKIPAMGFAFEKFTYLRSPYNVVEFTLVIHGILDSSFPSIMKPLAWVAFFRTVRIFKTLVGIRSLKKLRIILRALLVSFQNISNVLSFLVIFLVVYGGIATFVLKGSLEDRYS